MTVTMSLTNIITHLLVMVDIDSYYSVDKVQFVGEREWSDLTAFWKVVTFSRYVEMSCLKKTCLYLYIINSALGINIHNGFKLLL